jgi:hypothetical protein
VRSASTSIRIKNQLEETLRERNKKKKEKETRSTGTKASPEGQKEKKFEK